MKLRLLFPFAITISIFCISWTVLRANKKPKNYEVTGRVLLMHDYCGGAAPTESEKDGYQYPAQGTVLYVCRQAIGGRRLNYFDSIVCDTAGHFKIKLPQGNIYFVEGWKTQPMVFPADSKFEIWDTACYRREYNNSDFFLNVRGNQKDVKIILHRHCSWTRPCCNYNGPLPPGAPPTNRSGNQPGHQE